MVKVRNDAKSTQKSYDMQATLPNDRVTSRSPTLQVSGLFPRDCRKVAGGAGGLGWRSPIFSDLSWWFQEMSRIILLEENPAQPVCCNWSQQVEVVDAAEADAQAPRRALVQ